MLSKVLVCRIAEGINQSPRLALWPDGFAPFDFPSLPKRLYSTSVIKQIDSLRKFYYELETLVPLNVWLLTSSFYLLSSGNTTHNDKMYRLNRYSN